MPPAVSQRAPPLWGNAPQGTACGFAAPLPDPDLPPASDLEGYRRADSDGQCRIFPVHTSALPCQLPPSGRIRASVVLTSDTDCSTHSFLQFCGTQYSGGVITGIPDSCSMKQANFGRPTCIISQPWSLRDVCVLRVESC